MARWLIALVLGLAALGAVFFLWQRESAQKTATGTETAAGGDSLSEAPRGSPPATDGENTVAPSAAEPQGNAGTTATPDPSLSAEGVMVIDEPWARTGSAGGTSAVYMLLTNTSQVADRVVAVSSPDAETAVIHDTTIDSKNVATMRPANHVDLDPGVPLVFEPGGLHVMLQGLKHSLKEGDKISIQLTFQHAGTLRASIPVGELATGGDAVQP